MMSSITLNFCRLCFREDCNVSIFDYECDDAWSLADRIFECVSVQISQNDKLPQVICEVCLDQVIKWCTFKTTCDRNQRSWFLWLKSLACGTPQEIYDGLTENARRKSLELGFNHKISSPKSAFHRYSAFDANLHRPAQQDDDSVMIIGEELGTTQSTCAKELKIESTQSLVDFYSNKGINSPFDSHQKLSNGYMVVNSHNVQEHLSSNEVEKTSDSSKDNNIIGNNEFNSENDNLEVMSSVKDSPSITSVEKNKDGKSNVVEFEPIEDNDNDAEVESAFNNEIALASKTVVLEREEMLSKSEKRVMPSTTEGLTNNEDLNKSTYSCEPQQAEAPLQFPKPDIPRRFSSPCSQGKLNNSLSHDKDNCSISTAQPKRPDTPYPHEILKNMAPVLENSASLVKVFPQPEQNTPIKPSELRVHSDKSASSVPPAQMTQLAKPLSSIKPLNLSKLVYPPRFSSPDRDSISSDSSSLHQLNLPFRVKQELLSEPEDLDDNEGSLCNIYIKSEPMEFDHPRQEEQATVTTNPDLPPPNTTYCTICKKRYSAHSQLIRHVLQSEIHKRLVSFMSYGHKIDNQVISQISKEVRSEGYFRRAAKMQMQAMEQNMLPVNFKNDVDSPKFSDSVHLSTNQINPEEIFECQVCNVILKTRGSKTKHDNSFSHKSKVQALNKTWEDGNSTDTSTNASIRKLRSSVLPQQVVAGPSQSCSSYVPSETSHASTYTCPFAACNAYFGDGGQLIVHMHTHGISLPIQEVNKQIELSNKKMENKLLIRQPVDHSIRKFICRRCGKSFSKCVSLSNHMRKCRAIPAKTPPSLSIPCPVCQKLQKNKKTLAYHMKTYHPNTVRAVNFPLPKETIESSGDAFDFDCLICRKKFKTRLKLKAHNYKVHSKKPSPCRFCKKIFSSKSKLHTHYKAVHLKTKGGESVCYNCFKVFSSLSDCCKHRKAGCFPGMKIFTCTICYQSFKNLALLEEHKKEHHSELTAQSTENQTLDFSFLEDVHNTYCKICSKSYCNYYGLRRHVKTSHMQESDYNKLPPYKSGKSGSVVGEISSSNLEEEAQIETLSEPKTKNEDPQKYKCFYCEAKFSYTSSRFLHMRKVCRFTPPKIVCSHCKTERWPWLTGECGTCGKDILPKKRVASTKVESVPKKLKTNETEILSSSPPEFDEPFKSEVNQHSRLFKCSVGKRTFLCHKNMIGHSMTCDGSCKDQVVYCKTCQKLFPNPRIYLRHKPCTGKSSINPLTGKRFYTPRKHDPLKTLPCKFCEKKFKTKKGVSHHLRNVHNYYASVEKQNKPTETSSLRTSSRKPIANPSFGLEPVDSQEISEESAIDQQDQKGKDANNSQGNMCPSCDKNFVNHVSLLQHVKLFHKNKFSIAECTFCSKSILKKLLYEHGINCIKDQLVNINTLECVVCSTVFYNGDDEDTLSLKLQEHIINCCGKLTVGKGEKFKNKEKFLCLKCCMLFSSKKSLYAHSFERHGILIQTSPTQPKISVKDPVEGASITSTSDSLNEDIDFALYSSQDVSIPLTAEVLNTHPFSCHRCCKRFKTAKGLHSHKSSAHMYQSRKKKKSDPALKCKSCNRQFFNELKLRNHEKVHGIVKEIVLTEEDNAVVVDHAALPIVKELETIPLTKEDVVHIIGGSLPVSES